MLKEIVLSFVCLFLEQILNPNDSPNVHVLYFPKEIPHRFPPECHTELWLHLIYSLIIKANDSIRLTEKNPVILSKKTTKLLRHDLPLVSPCWLFPVTFSFPRSSETPFKGTHSIIFPRTKDNLTFCPCGSIWKSLQHLPFFSCWESPFISTTILRG